MCVVVPWVGGCRAYIFGFVVPNLVTVAIFVENRAFFNFGGVGCVGVCVLVALVPSTSRCHYG